MGPRLTVDTNVLVYAADRDAGPRHQTARALLARATHADCVLTLQALAEFFAVVTRKSGFSAPEAAVFVDSWHEMFTVVSATSTTLRQAMRVAEQHRLPFWDAMLWSISKESGCRYLLSEDFQTGRELGGVRFVNPFARGGLPAEVEAALG